MKRISIILIVLLLTMTACEKEETPTVTLNKNEEAAKKLKGVWHRFEDNGVAFPNTDDNFQILTFSNVNGEKGTYNSKSKVDGETEINVTYPFEIDKEGTQLITDLTWTKYRNIFTLTDDKLVIINNYGSDYSYKKQ